MQGADVLVTTAEGLTTVSVTYPAGPPRSGVWTLQVGGPATVDLYYFWGVTLSATAPDGIVVGQPSRVAVTARFPDGTPADPAVYRSLHLTLRAGGADVPLGALAGGTASGEVTVPPGGPAAVPLSALASATSAPSGIALGPVAASAAVPAVLPPAFPRLDTPRLTFPTLSGTTAATGTLRLTGSDRGPTRACYAPGPLTGPAMAGRVAVASDQRCLDLPAGAGQGWDFRLRTGAPADGRVEGTLTLTLTAADGQATTTVAVPVSAGLVRPVNEPLRWGLAAALVLLALAVPCVIGWVGNAAVGRFAVGPRTRVAGVPVVLTPGGPRRADGAPALFTPDDFRYLRRAGAAPGHPPRRRRPALLAHAAARAVRRAGRVGSEHLGRARRQHRRATAVAGRAPGARRLRAGLGAVPRARARRGRGPGAPGVRGRGDRGPRRPGRRRPRRGRPQRRGVGGDPPAGDRVAPGRAGGRARGRRAGRRGAGTPEPRATTRRSTGRCGTTRTSPAAPPARRPGTTAGAGGTTTAPRGTTPPAPGAPTTTTTTPRTPDDDAPPSVFR